MRLPRSGLCLLILCCFAAETGKGQMRSLTAHPPAGTWRVTLTGGGLGLGCDLTNAGGTYRYRPFGELSLSRVMHPYIHLGVFSGIGSMSAKLDRLSGGNNFFWAGLDAELHLPVRRSMLSPFIFARVGGILAKPSTTYDAIVSEGRQTPGFIYGAGIGLEFVYRRVVGVRVQGGSVLTTSDKLDNIVSGNQNDGLSFLALGVSYYFTFSRRSLR